MSPDVRFAFFETLGAEELTELAAFKRAIWPDWFGPNGQGDAHADVIRQAHLNAIPFGVGAFVGDTVIGIGAIDTKSFGQVTTEGPWLVGLAVDPAHRNQGIASQLVTILAAEALERGAPHVFATTRSAANLMRRTGWTDVRSVVDEDHKSWNVLRTSRFSVAQHGESHRPL